MAYNNNNAQQQQSRPQLPSIHNLNANYYPNYPPPPSMQDTTAASRQNYPMGPSGGIPSATDAYGNRQQAVPGSSTSENPGYSPMGQTPPETGQPSPAATSGSGGQTASQNIKGNTGGSEFVKKLFK